MMKAAQKQKKTKKTMKQGLKNSNRKHKQEEFHVIPKWIYVCILAFFIS